MCAKAMHPLALRILEHAAADPDAKFSPKELSEKFGMPLGNTAYHVRVLHTAGLLTRVGTRPVRGAVEHFSGSRGRRCCSYPCARCVVA